MTAQSFLRQLDEYRDITVEGLREHLFLFVREIAETAEEVGVKLAIHPDDPPFPLFGLPRVNSTQADTQKLFDAVPSPANGVTLCTGSYGANPSNDLVKMAKAFGPRIHFAHLRNTTREADGSFYEAEHLDGDTDMIGVVAALRDLETREAPRDPDAAGPWPPHRRRHRQEGEPRLFLHRQAQGSRGTAWRDAHGRCVPREACHLIRRAVRGHAAWSFGTIILPIGHSAMPASFRCAQAKGMPMMVTASITAVIRCTSASHQPANTSQMMLPMAPSAPGADVFLAGAAGHAGRRCSRRASAYRARC